MQRACAALDAMVIVVLAWRFLHGERADAIVGDHSALLQLPSLSATSWTRGVGSPGPPVRRMTRLDRVACGRRVQMVTSRFEPLPLAGLFGQESARSPSASSTVSPPWPRIGAASLLVMAVSMAVWTRRSQSVTRGRYVQMAPSLSDPPSLAELAGRDSAYIP